MFTKIYQNVGVSPEPWVWMCGFGSVFQFSKTGDLVIMSNMISTSENENIKHNF